MPANEYRFVTRWRVEGTRDEVFALLDDPVGFLRWWPSVWLSVAPIDNGDERGVGRVVRFTSKGWLPYQLQWTARTVEADPPRRLAIHATGDFEGSGTWTLSSDSVYTHVDYLWTVKANKPLLRYLSFVLRPIFAANHQWAMARGEESLKLELARRRAKTDQERDQIPPPPRPTFVNARSR